MTSGTIAERLSRLGRVMEAEGWDCVLATTPESVLYLSGALIHTQMLMRRRLCAVLVYRDGTASLIVPQIERHLAQRMSSLENIVTYNVHSESLVLAAAALIETQGRRPAVVAIEKTHLPVLDYEDLEKRLSSARFVGADEQLVKLRILKSPQEAAMMSFTATSIEDGILAAVDSSSVGTTEEQIAAAICAQVQRIGGGKVRSVTGLVAAGKNMLIPHHMSNATPLQAGDVVRVGCRAVFEGYNGIVTRTAYVDHCAAGTLDHYSRVHQAHMELLALLRPGVVGGEIYDRMAAVYRKLGLNPTNPHFGYGTGLEFQEKPKFAPGSQDVLEAGMTVLAESVSHDDIVGHLYLVDMVIIEADGVRVLSNRRDMSEMLRVSSD